MKLTLKQPLGTSGIQVPEVIYGTSYLGNLYEALSYAEKLALIRTWFSCTEKPLVIDTAGKYGAGLALEVIGQGLTELGVDPEDVIISNKLGWYRVPLTTDEPTFEPGAWAELENDCIQTFGYNEIINCFRQGNELLGASFRTDLVSIHDPDEYLLAAPDELGRKQRYQEILESYRALFDLKKAGQVKAVGIGSKDWNIIRELYAEVPFDWVMLATSYTIFSHPPDLISFLDQLRQDGVGIINSAIFHGGFFTGGDKFDYREVDPASETGRIIYPWRDNFQRVCAEFGVEPGDACIQFGLSHPAIQSLALNTSKPEKMKRNVEKLQKELPDGFWRKLKMEGLVDSSYPYL